MPAAAERRSPTLKSRLEHVPVPPLSIDRFKPELSPGEVYELDRMVAEGRELMTGRVVWNISSTAHGGGVAEMLASLIGYIRGVGVDARWTVIGGTPKFFELTKRIHNRLHGVDGDGGHLGSAERRLYQRVSLWNARELEEFVKPGDAVVLHDPQTAGLIRPMKRLGANVVWRSHVGLDLPNDVARDAWRFLLPMVLRADAYVFSRPEYVWQGLSPTRIAIVPPAIDAFSAKNQPLGEETVDAILLASGLTDGAPAGVPVFERADGTPGRVDRKAMIVEEQPVPRRAPLVVQISRWDRLKDPVGVMDGFVRRVAARSDAHLILAGPDVLAVTDDPEGAGVWGEVTALWRRLPDAARARVHLALLPMEDGSENAAIVNALQRRATVIVQKSLAEGFGLTVAEAMWKARPVVGSRRGGIQDQIVDGESGLLVEPTDLDAFGDAVLELLKHPVLAARIGHAAQERVRGHFLGPRQLAQYVELFGRLIHARSQARSEGDRAPGARQALERAGLGAVERPRRG